MIGKSIYLDNVDYQIVGILPHDFQFEKPVDLWIPLTTTDPEVNVRNAHFLSVIGRLRPGVSEKSVAADLSAVAKYESATFPDMFPPSAGFDFRARPYLEDIVGDIRLPLYVLLAAVGFVLLIACTNVANLLLAKAAPRQREIALRTALGARRWHLMRQLLTESILLAIIAGGIGVLLATWGTLCPRRAQSGFVATRSRDWFRLARAGVHGGHRLNDRRRLRALAGDLGTASRSHRCAQRRKSRLNRRRRTFAQNAGGGRGRALRDAAGWRRPHGAQLSLICVV